MRIEIKALQRRLGVTSVYVTHDQVEAMTMADRIIVMNAGRIEQIGTPADIYHTPASTFVASFMGAPPMNLLDGHCADGTVTLGEGFVLGTSTDNSTRKITVGIRPEDVELGGAGAVPFHVDIIEELGAHRLLHGRLADQAYTVHIPKDQHASTGKMPITLPEPALRLFDAETGRAL